MDASRLIASGRRARSKRSGTVGLTRMVSTLGMLAAVSGCGSEEPRGPQGKVETGPKTEVLAFENAFECAAKTEMTQEECTKARNEAFAANLETAPRFEGQGDCEAEWGDGSCVQHHHHGHHFFSPFMVGWIMGRNGGMHTPLYRHTGETGFSTANGYRLGYSGSPGKYYAGARALEKPRTVPRIKANTGRVSAGGFTNSRNGFSTRSGGYSGGSRFGG